MSHKAFGLLGQNRDLPRAPLDVDFSQSYAVAVVILG